MCEEIHVVAPTEARQELPVSCRNDGNKLRSCTFVVIAPGLRMPDDEVRRVYACADVPSLKTDFGSLPILRALKKCLRALRSYLWLKLFSTPPFIAHGPCMLRLVGDGRLYGLSRPASTILPTLHVAVGRWRPSLWPEPTFLNHCSIRPRVVVVLYRF